MSVRRNNTRPAAAAADDNARVFAQVLLAGSPTVTQPSGDATPRTDVLTVQEVARWLGVNKKTVYDAAGRRELPCARMGRRVLLSRIAVEAWLAGRKS
jgi:excisionase family DNA binding protein